MKKTLVAAALAMSLPAVTAQAQYVIQSKEPAGGTLEVYGFVQADFIQDFNRVDPDWAATLRSTKIPVVCPGDAGCGKDGETIFSVRQTRLGLRAAKPTEAGELSGRLEADLFGVGADAGQTTLRLRYAYGELGPFLFGQTESLFMDLSVFPNTIDYWGPTGMVFYRNIQARWTPIKRDDMKVAIGFENPGAVVDTGATTSGSVVAHNKLPDFTGQFRMNTPWGHYQVAGILRQLGYQTPGGANGNPSGTTAGYGVNLSGSYKLQGNDRVVAQLVMGKGIANYMNDAGSDIAPSSATGAFQGEAVSLVGWLAYYDHWWSERYSSSVGFSQTRQGNTGGQTSSALKTASYFSVNFLWYPLKSVMLGGELLWGQRENKNGDTGDDTRVQFSARYTF